MCHRTIWPGIARPRTGMANPLNIPLSGAAIAVTRGASHDAVTAAGRDTASVRDMRFQDLSPERTVVPPRAQRLRQPGDAKGRAEGSPAAIEGHIAGRIKR
jgi:hypothetical protein